MCFEPPFETTHLLPVQFSENTVFMIAQSGLYTLPAENVTFTWLYKVLLICFGYYSVTLEKESGVFGVDLKS